MYKEKNEERELAFALTLIVQDDSECPILIFERKKTCQFQGLLGLNQRL